MLRGIFAIITLIFLLPLASALTLSVSGGCVGEKVTVTTDGNAIIIFRMNSGTPIFSEASPSLPAYFKPRVKGELLITAIAGDEKVSKTIQIKTCSSGGGGGGGGGSSQHVLPYGTFEVLGKNVEWRTAYGALKKAGEILHFTITPELTDWGIFVKCVKNLCKGDIGDTSGWMYWVNYPDEPMPGVAATDFRVSPGDRIIWYFSRSMSDTPENSPYKIYIDIGDNYEITVSMVWPSKVPPFADFTFSPSNPTAGEEVVFNASKSVDDGQITDYIWNFGDGKSGRGMTVTHTYTSPGIYEVSLTVFDNDGLSDTVTKTVNVSAGIKLNSTEQVILLQPGETKVIPSEDVVANFSVTALTFQSEKPAEVVISDCHIPPGVVYATFYRWFEIEANESMSAKIDFRVPKDIAEGKEVALMKYNGSWFELPTEKMGEDENYLYFSAETNSFSVFAITIKWDDFPLNATDERIQRALEWLKTIQNEDGGFANPGENSSISATAWAIMALVAAGEDPHEWVKNGKSPIDFIKERLRGEMDTMGAEDYARIILALVYAGENPRNFADVDFVSKLKSYVKENGQIGDFTYKTIWGIIALASVGENVSMSAEWLKSHQNADGGFSWSVGEESDFDDTAAAIQALIAAGEPKDSAVIKKALDYLKTGQNDDGGMRYFGNSASNAGSDSWTIQALVATGINPTEWKRNNTSVVEHLLSLQAEEGYFKYTKFQTSNPGYMTVSAIMALLGKPHPIKVNTSLATVSVTPSTTATTTVTVSTTVTATASAAAVTTATPETPATPGFSSVAVIVALGLTAALLRRRV